MKTSPACNAVALRTGRLYMPLLTELGGLGMDLCYRHVAPDGALHPTLRRSGFSIVLLFIMSLERLKINAKARARSFSNIEESAHFQEET
jgi:hypothetical protein